jgi:hypothetical protein
MKHRHAFALAAAAALFAAAGTAAADCAAVFKAGAKFHVVQKTVATSRPLTVTVEKNEKGYVKLGVVSDDTKKKLMMPGSVSGDTALFAGAERPVVWTCTCDAKGTTCQDSGPGAEGHGDIRLEAGK